MQTEVVAVVLNKVRDASQQRHKNYRDDFGLSFY